MTGESSVVVRVKGAAHNVRDGKLNFQYHYLITLTITQLLTDFKCLETNLNNVNNTYDELNLRISIANNGYFGLKKQLKLPDDTIERSVYDLVLSYEYETWW